MPDPAAVLFDVDGTLVDSNYLHTRAWHRAFREAGAVVPSWRIHRAIGMDGSTLIETLAPDADADRADALHSQYYRELSGELTLLPGAREILHALHDRGLRIVLATSAPPDELDRLRELLDSEAILHAVTNADDVQTAKPDPAIVRVALDRAGVPAERAVFVGDTVWDARAATDVGVPAVGVLSGGVAREELTSAGAEFVRDDVAELLRDVEQSPIGTLL